MAIIGGGALVFVALGVLLAIGWALASWPIWMRRRRVQKLRREVARYEVVQRARPITSWTDHSGRDNHLVGHATLMACEDCIIHMRDGRAYILREGKWFTYPEMGEPEPELRRDFALSQLWIEYETEMLR